ncbi:MAG: PilZ domain-containing protein [Metallibacterium scheffleri]|jgi:type IV pilus assembly protein PilZ|uniref:PilZ domain-containing protein n=1 Tax=Metallibacterium scheffleri TaxID=993689 RepID=UPI0026F2570E|nr:PilZ domain-containing protein [Metallibacterium scheffleri]MCK9367615.1 PilZ domain-containing protein [Metallibacterium scheffleri]
MAAPAQPNASARQSILPVAIKDEATLYQSYMPFIKGGGLFVPTTKRYNLGDDLFLLVNLLEDKERLPVTGTVVWITPQGAQGNRVAGIGVQFSESPEGEVARQRIEALLGAKLASEKPTYTL